MVHGWQYDESSICPPQPGLSPSKHVPLFVFPISLLGGEVHGLEQKRRLQTSRGLQVQASEGKSVHPRTELIALAVVQQSRESEHSLPERQDACSTLHSWDG